MKWILFVLIFLMSIMSASAAFETDLSNGTALYYSFDNANLSGSDPLDLTSNNNDGTNIGADTNVTGLINEAFFFSSGDTVTSANTVDFATDSNFTIMFWRKDNQSVSPHSIWGTNFNTNLFSRGTIFFRETNTNCGANIMSFTIEGVTNGNLAAICVQNDTLFDNVFHHIALAYNTNNNTCEVYIDGKKTPINFSFGSSCDLVDEPINTGGTNGLITINRFSSSGGTFGEQTMDEFSVWNTRYLNSLQIRNIVNNKTGLQFPFPVEIPFFSNFNMTSAGGCTNWNLDPNVPCSTLDRTPTVKVDTSENATCRMGPAPVSTPAFVNLTSLRDCSTTGNQSHTCTVIFDDRLPTGSSDLIIGCNSTSGFNETVPLAITITTLDFVSLNQTNDIVYTPDWSQIDFSSLIDLSGNWSWNATFLNVSPFNVTPVLFIVTNNDTSRNATLSFQLNDTDPWWDWNCLSTNITTLETPILNATANTTTQFNCFLDLKNISTTYVDWIVTENRARWDFVLSFFFEEI